MHEENEKNGFKQGPRKNKPGGGFYGFAALSMAAEMSAAIFLLLVIFVKAGAWADSRYGTKIFTMLGIILAIALSSLSAAKIISRHLKNIK